MMDEICPNCQRSTLMHVKVNGMAWTYLDGTEAPFAVLICPTAFFPLPVPEGAP
jgi:hypothetical protein